jgi:hypothetical protein
VDVPLTRLPEGVALALAQGSALPLTVTQTVEEPEKAALSPKTVVAVEQRETEGLAVEQEEPVTRGLSEETPLTLVQGEALPENVAHALTEREPVALAVEK